MTEERDAATQQPNAEGEQTLEKQDTEIELSEDVLAELDENVVKTIKSLQAQKAHYRSKYEKEKEARAGIETKIKSLNEVPEEKPAKKESTSEDEWRSKMEFAMKYQGKVDMSDLDKIVSISKLEGVSLDEAYNSDIYKGYLKAKEEAASQQGTVPTPGSDSPVVSSENFDKVTPEQIKDMDSATFAKYEAWLKTKSRNLR